MRGNAPCPLGLVFCLKRVGEAHSTQCEQNFERVGGTRYALPPGRAARFTQGSLRVIGDGFPGFTRLNFKLRRRPHPHRSPLPWNDTKKLGHPPTGASVRSGATAM
jgi:hypothetical protein